MGKKKNKSVAAAMATKAKAKAKATGERKPPPPSDVISKSEKYPKEEQNDGKNKIVVSNKKIYASFVNDKQRPTWVEINPHYSESEDWFSVDRMPSINSPPPHLDVFKLRSCGTIVHGSKVYFIGGKFLDEFIANGNVFDEDGYFIGNKIYSDKIFTYHIFSHEWEELPCKLNIARSNPMIVLKVGNEIYVMDGIVDAEDHAIKNKEEWIEWFNVVDVDEKKTTLDFLPAASAPPNAVFEHVSSYQFAYEARNELVFVMSEALGGYSFNCISKTWAPFHENISKHASFMCDRVVVVDHLVFLRYERMIYAYDLIDNQLVLSQRVLNLFKEKLFGGSDDDENSYQFIPEMSFLARAGNDTLVLIECVFDSDTGKHIHLYKFQIQIDEEQQQQQQLSLLQIGCGHFSPSDTDSCLIDVVVAG